MELHLTALLLKSEGSSDNSQNRVIASEARQSYIIQSTT